MQADVTQDLAAAEVEMDAMGNEEGFGRVRPVSRTRLIRWPYQDHQGAGRSVLSLIS